MFRAVLAVPSFAPSRRNASTMALVRPSSATERKTRIRAQAFILIGLSMSVIIGSAGHSRLQRNSPFRLRHNFGNRSPLANLRLGVYLEDCPRRRLGRRDERRIESYDSVPQNLSFTFSVKADRGLANYTFDIATQASSIQPCTLSVAHNVCNWGRTDTARGSGCSRCASYNACDPDSRMRDSGRDDRPLNRRLGGVQQSRARRLRLSGANAACPPDKRHRRNRASQFCRSKSNIRSARPFSCTSQIIGQLVSLVEPSRLSYSRCG